MIKITFFLFLSLFFLTSNTITAIAQDVEKREEHFQAESEKTASLKTEKQHMSQSQELKKSSIMTGPLYPKLPWPKTKEDPDDPLEGPPFPLIKKAPKESVKN